MKSIRRHLVFTLLAGFAALWAASSVTLCVAVRAHLLAGFDSGLRTKMQALATLTEDEKGSIELDFASEFMPSFERRDAPDYFQIWRADGGTVERSKSLHDSSLARPEVAHDSFAFTDITLPDGQPGRAAITRFAPHIADEKIHPPRAGGEQVTLVVAIHRRELDRVLGFLKTTLLALGAAMIAGSALVVTAAVRTGLRPLAGVAERAAGISATSLHARFSTDDLPCELIPICTRLNDLLARLETSFDRERRFSADVAHELRTPIAELRALAEVALKWPDDPAANAAAMRDTLAAAQQMESIVTSLLALIRCESGSEPVRREPVALCELVGETWKPLAQKAAAKNLAVTFDIPAGLTLDTDRTLFRSVLVNLLDNAVEYTPSHGAVELRAHLDGSTFTLSLANTADNLRADDLANLFERFWRKDSARSDQHHSGLGLPLAKAFCERLGLRISARLADSSTLLLTVKSADILA